MEIKGLVFNIGGVDLTLTWSVFLQWFVMAIIIVAVLILTSKLETVPNKKQVTAEFIVEKIYGLVDGVMGKGYRHFAPYIGTLMIFLAMLNMLPLIAGLRAPTSDYSVTLAFALMTFVIIHVTAIRHNGFGGYLKGYAQPIWPLLPLNIIERVFVPVSLSLRLFGNITAAVIMMDLLYEALEWVSHQLIHFPLLTAVIPIPFHLYFDVFDGLLQMVVFTMLTMLFIKTTSEH